MADCTGVGRLCAEWVRTQKNCPEFTDVVRANGERAQLLAALKGIHEHCPCDPDINPRWQAAWDAMRAAIAKAEGR